MNRWLRTVDHLLIRGPLLRSLDKDTELNSLLKGPFLPYCVRRWRTPAVSRFLPSGPYAASAESAGIADFAGMWPKHYPGYGPPPPAPRRSAQRCLRQERWRILFRVEGRHFISLYFHWFGGSYLKYTAVCGRTSASPSILCSDSSILPPKSSTQTLLRR